MKKQNSFKSNQKGFTLIELIAVIVLLSVIATLAIVSVSSIKSKVNEREYVNLASTIEAAAQGYAEETGVTKMFVQTLIDKGLVETDDETKQVYDPRDNSSLNCRVVKYENGEATLVIDEKENPVCDTTILSDDAIRIKYKTSQTGPLKNLDGNTWLNQSIILVVDTTGAVDIKLDEAKYSWSSPLAPDKTYNDSELLINDKYVNDTYQVTVTANGRKYTAYGKVKIDQEQPKVFNLIDTKPEDWSPTKVLQFELSDAESGLQAYSISFDSTTVPSRWEMLPTNQRGKNTYTVTNKEFNVSSLTEGQYIYVWVKDMVGNVNVSDFGANGGGALQINNIDGKFDEVTLTGTPKNLPEGKYTQSVTLTGTVKDLKSGTVGWYCSTSSTPAGKNSTLWNPVTKTNNKVNISCPTTYTANGWYYLHAIDAVGNTGLASYKVENIDRVIDYVNIYDTQAAYGYRTSSKLSASARDDKAGIVAWAITTSSSKPSSWNYITKTNGTISQNYTADRNTTYYFHVLDDANNWAYDSVTISNSIVEEKSYSDSLYSTTGSSISGNFYLSGAVAITNWKTDTGSIGVSLSGNRAYVNAYYGTTYKQPYSATCQKRASSYTASYNMVCNSGYYCQNGGTASGATCVGYNYPIESNPRSYITWTCNNGKWNKTAGEWPNTPCSSHYHRANNTWGCNDPTPVSGCTNGAKQSYYYGCKDTCIWDGNYPATCRTNLTPEYYCKSYSDTLSGSTCYYCGYGETYNSWTGECNYACTLTYDYWKYNITIYYYVYKY